MKIDYEILNDAVALFGEKSQIIMAIEELAELQKALCKIFRYDDINSIIDEMADAYIMLAQLEIIFCNRSVPQKRLEGQIKLKLNRLKKLIDERKSIG